MRVASLRTNALLVFIILTSSLHFLTIRPAVITLLATHAELSALLFVVLLAIGFLVASVGVLLTKWSLEPKYLTSRNLHFYLGHWLLTFMVLTLTSHLKLWFEGGYRAIDSSSMEAWRDGSYVALACSLIAASSLGVFSAFYRWTAPTLSRLDYTRLKALLVALQRHIDVTAIGLSTSHQRRYCEYASKLLESARIEIESNLAYEDSANQQRTGQSLREVLLALEDFFADVGTEEQFSDLTCLRQGTAGGYVTSSILDARTAVQRFTRTGKLTTSITNQKGLEQ